LSTSATFFPIVAAVAAADAFVGPKPVWQPVNGDQARFLREAYGTGRSEIASIPEIESIASRSADALAAFCARRGFPMAFEPLTPPRFGVAAFLDVKVEWPEPGTPDTITTPEGRSFPGVEIEDAYVHVCRAKTHAHPIANLATRSGDQVYLSVASAPGSGLDLVEAAMRLSQDLAIERDYEGVLFPMVNLEQPADVSWLAGLWTTSLEGDLAAIQSAQQHNRFRMNQFGARAESVTQLYTVLGVRHPKPVLVIDRPFLVWIQRPGLSQPLFVAHVTPEDWRDPGDLDAA
jgi:hypothetical protein